MAHRGLVTLPPTSVELVPVRNDPQEAGLLGVVQLAPRWVFQGHDTILALDAGGSTIRAGVVALHLRKASDLSHADVWKAERWDHDQEKHPTREKTVVKMAEMLNELVGRAEKEKLRLAPFIGISCPGVIAEDGTIERGADSLPGKWDGRKFNLPQSFREEIPRIGKHETAIVMRNDAVVQGLSELPAMADIERWGALTIGMGFGNAQFRNRPDRIEP
jgi:predicted NBD/HSP70 family sugar kinase